MLGRVVHIGVDLTLLSAFLAGVKRNTGLSPKTDLISNEDVKKYTEKYLGVGEWIFDSGAAYMGSSEYFIRK